MQELSDVMETGVEPGEAVTLFWGLHCFFEVSINSTSTENRSMIFLIEYEEETPYRSVQDTHNRSIGKRKIGDEAD